jgi:hypothetical protein
MRTQGVWDASHKSIHINTLTILREREEDEMEREELAERLGNVKKMRWNMRN